MGESAVLLRSFSHPSDAFREAREGDPIRALTESISFGRFMSDSLAWEKWSTFSHNRYLEEVEKFSKPGSVAEKKAYFEAHYKRKAAMKAAAAEEANAAANDVPELKTTSEIQNNYPMDTESVKANSHVGINEQKEQYMVNISTDSATDTESADMNHVVAYDQWKEDSPDTEVVHSADANACYSINIPDDLEDADAERSEAITENAVNEENPTQTDNLKQLKNPDVDNKIEASPVERMHNKEVVDQENSTSSCKKKQSICSSKSSSQSGVSGLMSYPAKQVPSLPARNVENIATNSKESVGDSNEKKRVVPKFLYKSINFSPRVSETSKASLKKPKNSSTPTRTPTRASVNGVSKHLSKLFQSENKRSEALVSKSVSGGITEVGLFLSLPVEGLESSSANGRKARSPPSISSPFSFRSKERAAKRKEFFEKLEEKNNTKGAEEGQLETRSKEKVEQDNKKLRQSTGFKAKQNEHLYHGSRLQNIHMKKEKVEHDFEKLQQSTGFKAKPNENSHHCPPLPSNRMKKKPLSQPWSPKLGGKSTPTVVQDTSSRPPRKPSVNTESSKPVLEKNKQSTTRSVTSLPKLGRKPNSNPVQDANTRPPWRSSMNNASFKRIIEKNNTNTNRSVTPLPKKSAHENASPNIQP